MRNRIQSSVRTCLAWGMLSSVLGMLALHVLSPRFLYVPHVESESANYTPNTLQNLQTPIQPVNGKPGKVKGPQLQVNPNRNPQTGIDTRHCTHWCRKPKTPFWEELPSGRRPHPSLRWSSPPSSEPRGQCLGLVDAWER